MKLIVDIDENDYELFKNSTIKPDWDTMWHGKEKEKEIMFATVGLIECLKDGIPISTDGDLISHNEYQGEWANGFHEGFNAGNMLAEAFNERPKGKWIDHWDKGYVECPFCHKPITGGDLNFCVKCGADMRKGGTE